MPLVITSFGKPSAISGAGQGVGGIDDIPTTAELIARLKNEYQVARATLCGL